MKIEVDIEEIYKLKQEIEKLEKENYEFKKKINGDYSKKCDHINMIEVLEFRCTDCGYIAASRQGITE